MKTYTFHFTQSFEETIPFQANNQAEAEEQLEKEWGMCSELEIHSVTEED